MVKLALVIGQGEVGNPLFEMLVEVFGADEILFRDIDEPGWHEKFQFLHICFPQTVNWRKSIREYVVKYDPKAVIIHSTVHPGTTQKLNLIKRIFYYSPVRGNVKDGMRWCLEKYTKYVAGPENADITTLSEGNPFLDVMQHMKGAGFRVEYVPDTKSLEYAKILDLAWYGLNIAFYQELERIAMTAAKPDERYNIIKKFIESTPKESEGKVQRSVFYGGFIGGHCVIPAIEKVLAEHDIPMLKAAIESNIKREREIIVDPNKLLFERAYLYKSVKEGI